MKVMIAAVLGCAVLAACGGGGDAGKNTTPTLSARTPKPSATAALTAKTADVTPGTTGTANATAAGAAAGGTPPPTANSSGDANPAAASAPADATVPATPDPTGEGQPQPPGAVIAGTVEAGHDPVLQADATLTAAENDNDASFGGGDPTKPQNYVGDVPDPPSGASIDARTIAAPNPPNNDLQVMIDLDASTPGIQSTRDVKVGDVIRVGVVVVNAPSVTALGFDLDYDKTEMVAPTIINGASTDRNPDLNLGALGGASAGWLCAPTPEGDRDDAPAANGDGDPSTGQAFLDCFTPAAGHQGGTIVLATIEFRVTAKGTSTLSLAQLSLWDDSITQYGRCDGDPGDSSAIPCRTATLSAS